MAEESFRWEGWGNVNDMDSLKCEKCENELTADEVNISAAIAACSACGHTFALRSSSTKKLKESVKGIKIENFGDGILIERRWLHQMFFIPIIVGSIFLINSYLFLIPDVLMPDTPWEIGPKRHLLKLFWLFPIVGCISLYFGVATLFNRTLIHVRKRSLRILHAPFPWPGVKKIESKDLEQIYVEENVHQKNGSHASYTLFAVLKKSGKKKLLSGLKNYDQALKIELEIEKALGIKDRRVHEEKMF